MNIDGMHNICTLRAPLCFNRCCPRKPSCQQMVLTGAAANVSYNSASIINNAFSGIPGVITTAGIEYSANACMIGAVTVSSGVTSSPFSQGLTSLQPNTTYYYRAVVVTLDSKYCGDIKCFTTGREPVVVSTGEAVNITSASATITDNTFSGVTGVITALGVQYSTDSGMSSPVSVNSDTTGSPYSVNLTGLQANTTYYFRAFVMTQSSIYYGQIDAFTAAILT